MLLVAMSRMQCELPRVRALAFTLGLKLASLETRSSAPDVPMAFTSNPDSGRNFSINAKKTLTKWQVSLKFNSLIPRNLSIV